MVNEDVIFVYCRLNNIDFIVSSCVLNKVKMAWFWAFAPQSHARVLSASVCSAIYDKEKTLAI